IAVHGEMLAGHGAACGREGSGQVRISENLQDSLGQRAGGDRGQEACAGAAQEVLVIAEVGRHDRAAGGEIDRDLALDGVVLATGESGMDQDIGAAGPPTRTQRASGRDSKICGNASIRIGTPWLGWTMLPTYMMTLFSGCTPGIDAGLPGRSYSARSMPG